MWRRVVAKDAAGEVLDPEERAWLDARSARDLADLFESQLQSIARAWRVGRLHTFDSDAAEALEMLAESFEA